MAKDPAMLWYWGDWYSGTSLMTRFLKGCYMDVLHAQFNTGHLSIEEIKICLGSDFGSSWPAIQKKFKQDENGLFFNERLEQEKKLRQKYTASRKQARLNGIENKKNNSTYDVTYVERTIPRTENENEDSILKKEELHESKKIDDPIGGTAIRAIARSVWEDQIWKDSICSGNQMNEKDLRVWMSKYNASIMNDTIPGFTESTYKKMFQGWVNFQKSKGVTVGDPAPIHQQNQPLKKLA